MAVYVTTFLLLVITPFVALLYYLSNIAFRKRRPGEPVVIKGNIILGNSAEFASNAPNFFLEKQKIHGHCFTIRLLTQHVTMIVDPHSYSNFTREKNFDFAPVANEIASKVFGFSIKELKPFAVKMANTVKGDSLNKLTANFVKHLNNSCADFDKSQNLAENEWKKAGLLGFAVETKFNAIHKTIFGDGSYHEQFNAKKLNENFKDFDRCFNYFWLGFPKWLFPKGNAPFKRLQSMPSIDEIIERQGMSDFMHCFLTTMRGQGSSEDEMRRLIVNMNHINHNAYRLCFWSLAKLLQYDKALSAVLEEVESAVSARLCSETNIATLTMRDVESLEILDSFLNETMRVISGVMNIRRVEQDTWFTTSDGEKHLIRKGDRVAMYPPSTHMDPEVFENPSEFKFDRFINATLYKDGKPLPNPVTVFGPRCPGIRSVQLQAKWFLMTVLTRYELRPVEGEQVEFATAYQGYEIMPPQGDVQFQYRVKQEPPTMEFSYVD